MLLFGATKRIAANEWRVAVDDGVDERIGVVGRVLCVGLDGVGAGERRAIADALLGFDAQRLAICSIGVQAIVLYHEQNVEENAEERQAQFHRILVKHSSVATIPRI